MKIELKKILKTIIVSILFLPVCSWAASYRVSTSTSIVDGDTFCGGATCTSSDTIIIEGGVRGDLLFKDFNGNGSYITITNQNINPDSRVEITHNGDAGWATLSFNNCKYLDIKGNNDPDLTYGIKVLDDGSPYAQAAVWFYNDCDNIKFSYVEISHENSTQSYGNGIAVTSYAGDNTVIFDTFEIHHNYIHDTRSAGMYLGRNRPLTDDDPYIANFSVHDNLLENIGGYGITLKGVHSTSDPINIYNNIIKVTGLVSGSSGDEWHGIGVQYFYGSTYSNIYGNWIEKTRGPGLKIGFDHHQIYNNTIAGCGTGNETEYGHGIYIYYTADSVNIYDNIIIQPKRYGIYADSNADYVNTMSRNLICGAGQGEWYQEGSDLTESSGVDANIYHADCDDFNFPVWSDDGYYSNDQFLSTNSQGPSRVEGLSIVKSLTKP